jgi:hypothetical protein
MEVVFVPDPDHIDRDDGLLLALSWLEDQAKSGGVLIVVPVQQSLTYAPILERVTARFPVTTERTLRNASISGRAVLAIWPSQKSLEDISRDRPRSMCVVQWVPEQTNDWLKAQRARDLSGTAPALGDASVSDPIVLAALEDMAGSVNPGNVLVQTNDREHAILTLRLLHDRAHEIDPDELYRWAISIGWEGKGATNLKKLAAEVLAGVKHRIRERQPFGDDTYQAWKRQAASRDRSK